MINGLVLVQSHVVVLLQLDSLDALIDALLSVQMLSLISPASVLAGILDGFVQPPEEVLMLKSRRNGIRIVHLIDGIPETQDESGYVDILQSFIASICGVAICVSKLVYRILLIWLGQLPCV